MKLHSYTALTPIQKKIALIELSDLNGLDLDLINKQIQDSPYQIFFLATQGMCSEAFIAHCLNLHRRAASAEIISKVDKIGEICFTKEAHLKVSGFRSSTNLAQLFVSFIDIALELRWYSVLEIGSARDILLAREALSDQVAKVANFEIDGLSFKLSDTQSNTDQRQLTLSKQVMSEAVLTSTIQEGVNRFNAHDKRGALEKFTEVLDTGVQIPDILYLKAFVEAQLGLKGQALRSLIFLEQQNPKHEMGLQLLNELQCSMKKDQCCGACDKSLQ